MSTEPEAPHLSGLNRTPPPTQGTKERAEHQRAAEALIDDHGGVSSDEEAMAAAARELAERMVSTTPEIVMSAFGEKVGTNMDNRLGDPGYVLVPDDIDHPSKGAEVLHVSKLDPANPRHHSRNTRPMDSPEAETLVREITVRAVMSSWSHGSNRNTRSLALQEVAREEFGLPGALEWDTDPETSEQVDIELLYNKEAFRDFLSTQYELTQERLRERNISQIVGYRPMAWPDGAARPSWSDLEAGTDLEVPDRPLQCWFADRQTAVDWVQQHRGHGTVLIGRLDAEDVVSLPTTGMGSLSEKTWVARASDPPITLDGVFRSRAWEHGAQQDASIDFGLGAPRLHELHETAPGAKSEPERPRLSVPENTESTWRPLKIDAGLDPDNPIDDQIRRALAGETEYPAWWPRFDRKFNLRVPESDGKPEPSDLDLNICSDQLVNAAAERFAKDNPDRHQGELMTGHGYLNKKAGKSALPHLFTFIDKWEPKLGRPLSPGVFESSGPMNTAKLERPISVHFHPTDFMIHTPNVGRKLGPDPRTVTRTLKMESWEEKGVRSVLKTGAEQVKQAKSGTVSRLEAMARQGQQQGQSGSNVFKRRPKPSGPDKDDGPSR